MEHLLADAPSQKLLAEYRRRYRGVALVVLLDGTDNEEIVRALSAGARAVLNRSASRNEIIAAVKAIAAGLVVVAPQLLAALFNAAPFADAGHARLTPRELEVLAAMADGASNKAIARRLGISFHTAKFHVAGILDKLDADSRTEAVAKAAQLGLVML